ncbi:hypothetical protein NECAME_10832 [Necator americanus]|uniref:Uncharacterized protein n=1 Tax=Necator americanus TaxID=51031 RepID=W2T6W2_NECAM|nr:hypothetical protein NECAME_10832 [Necator americanus]ETN77740.1 hypothetical protein NECAME_10832 [Necator americanus]
MKPVKLCGKKFCGYLGQNRVLGEGVNKKKDGKKVKEHVVRADVEMTTNRKALWGNRKLCPKGDRQDNDHWVSSNKYLIEQSTK